MSKTKKPRKTDEETRELVDSFCLKDDVLFETFIEDEEACEELLQVTLENPKIRVKKGTLVPQKSIHIVKKRSVRVDAYVEGHEDEVFSIEIQRANNTSHVKRVRYIASCITVMRSEPQDDFKDIQELYIIYISEFDVFKKGLTTYHVESCITETGEPVDDGLHVVFINTEIDDHSKIARYIKHFTETEFEDDEFPKISSRFYEIKHNETEVERMCQKVEEYAKRETIYSAIKIFDDLGYTEEEIIKEIKDRFNLTEEQAVKYFDDVFVRE